MEPEDKEEARFIARLASRDERAFNELVVLYQERVFRILLRMLGRRGWRNGCQRCCVRGGLGGRVI